MQTLWHGEKLMDVVMEQGRKRISRVCIAIENDAKRVVPVDTGTLRRSIAHEIEVSPTEIVGRVGTNTKYAPYVEYGTYKMPAQPYLRPAFWVNIRKLQEK